MANTIPETQQYWQIQEKIDKLQQQRIEEEFGELKEQPVNEISTYKYDRVPRDKTTGQYKKTEKQKNE